MKPETLPLVAFVLLAGLGIYYFLFERDRNTYWLTLLLGALLNLYIAYHYRKRRK